MDSNGLRDTAKLEGMYRIDDIPVASFLKAVPGDNRRPQCERPMVVPSYRMVRVYGVAEHELMVVRMAQRHTVPREYGYISDENTYTLVSPRPFVAVGYTDDSQAVWGNEFAPLHRQLFVPRQIHKGQFGQRPPFLRPKVIASDLLDPMAPGDNPRTLNWVSLDELCERAGMKPSDLLREFAGFSLSNWYEPNVVLSGPDKVLRVYTNALPHGFCGGEALWGDEAVLLDTSLKLLLDEHPERYRVTQTFAFAVLRLLTFGYPLGCDQPEGGVPLRIPTPKVTKEPKLSLLTAEQLSDRQRLVAELSAEVPQIIFSRKAEGIIGHDNWVSNPVMNDELGGVGQYYNAFKQLTGFDGRLVIARCYWTRAGAGKSPHHYAGMLAVFPKAVDDPRRDPSAILRLWFLPDSVHRMTPEGSKGGLCPLEVPNRIAPAVEQFLLDLGYDYDA